MLLQWLKNQPLYPKIYWATEKEAVAAAGTASPRPRQFGWQPFTHRSPFFFTPAVEKRGIHRPLPLSPYLIERRSSIPERQTWENQVLSALQEISKGTFDKTVLAKQQEIQCATPLDPFLLCSALRGKIVFLIQEEPSSAFLGASPEMLYKREGRKIECDALAGTRPLALSSELLSSEKDRREFFHVQNFLLEALSPLCIQEPSATALQIENSTTMCHLHAKIHGVLKEEIDDAQILAALHPTPAVGGIPRKEALSFLSKTEPFDRFLYASPIGLRSEQSAEFAVAIRSARIQNCTAFLYAGAGIVEGSVPSREWEETEWKLGIWNQFFIEKSCTRS